MDRDREMARRIAQGVAQAGGRTYYVGGLVRDEVLGRPGKDIDIEVHGVAPEVLEGILSGLGRMTTMGASFGIFGLKGYDIDIAMPRQEHATGRGHKDFTVSVDPFIGTEKAALRRDFTMNAMMQDVLTGEIIDHFGGRGDIAAGLIRHVNDQTFAEDPLRVLRAAQFAARFGFAVAEETRALCAGMDTSALSHERVMGEMEKALRKADRPSVFFDEVRAMNQLSPWFAELSGQPFDALGAVLDAAAALRDAAAQPLAFMVTALTCGLDAAAGDELIRRLTSEVNLHKYAAGMRPLIARLNALADARSGRTAVAELLDQAVSPDDLLLLSRALRMAKAQDDPETEAFLRQRLAEYRRLMAQPCVMGADLVSAGLRPGRAMGVALKYAHQLQLEGVPKGEALEMVLEYARGMG